MKKVKITVLRKTTYSDLIEKYEKTKDYKCKVSVGQEWISENGEKPFDMCDMAWEIMELYVRTLARGGGDFFDGWMENPKSAMISCPDGFRPVTFYIETIEE